MRSPARLLLPLSASLFLAACGGAGGAADPVGGGATTNPTGGGTTPPPPPPATVTMTIPASLTYGGGCAEVRESGGVVTPPQTLFVADYGVNAARSIFTFFVGAGEDREVLSAKLRLVPSAVRGDPLENFTNGLRAERVNIVGPIDAFDYEITPAVGAPSPMGPLPSEGPGVIELDVTEQLRGWIGSGSNFFYLRVRLDHLIANNSAVQGFEFALSSGGNPAFFPTLIAEVR